MPVLVENVNGSHCRVVIDGWEGLKRVKRGCEWLKISKNDIKMI